MNTKKLKEQEDKLEKTMDQWRTKYTCRNKCKDWKENKFCTHLVNAREKYFRKEINLFLNNITEAFN